MSNFLYTIIIYPLIQIIEFAFMLFNNIFKNPGISVIGVSFAVSILCLPLYMVAENWQQIQRDIEKRLEPGIKRIKETFKGDEQYMILTTFYRENHYHPLMALRSSFGLLIQIPFFMAAYSFLSNLPVLQGQSFLFIKDMGVQDAMFHIGSFPVNVLPIAMTVINIIAGAIYTKGFKWKDKMSIYGMALIFLAILYASPSGLVLYWTMNNLFSLVKNVFYKLKNPGRILYYIMCASIAGLDVFVLFVHEGSFHKRIIMAVLCTILVFIPLDIRIVNQLLDTVFKPLTADKSARFTLFVIGSLGLCLLSGFVIPSYVINSSVVEFCGIDEIGNPLYFLYNSTLQMFGIYVFWTFCIYFLFHEKVQTLMAVFLPSLLLTGIINTFFFGGDYGTLSRLITFSQSINQPGKLQGLLNLIICALVFCIPLILFKFKLPKILNTLLSIILIAELGITIIHIGQINSGYKSYKNDSAKRVSEEKTVSPVYHLTKDGKNVIVFMFDRAENSYVEPIFNDYPELNDIFTGFTYYPNTVSFNAWTLLGAPSLYGGYEYTPYEVNKRENEKLVDKHNEALLLMPRVFTEQADFSATVSDLSWANFSWIADMSICEPFSKINGINVERKYTSLWVKENPDKVKPGITSAALKRNLSWFSLFKEVPMIMRDSIYKDGLWWSSDNTSSDIMEFLDFYSALDYLPELTDFSGNGNQYFTIVNETTHSNQHLQAPDFVPSTNVTDTGKKPLGDYLGVCGNIAMFKRLGEWIEYLKANDCYDNTRIIIVADHGIGTEEGKKLYYKGTPFPDYYNPDHFHPILLVKDFNAKGHLTKNNDFMTNADVPSIAFKNLINNPVNPNTGKEIKEVNPLTKIASGVVKTHNWQPGANNVNTYKVPDEDWYSVSTNIFDPECWEKGIKK